MYVLLVTDSVNSRDYGVPNTVSNISGNVKIVGDLSIGKAVNLYSLKVDGDLIVDIGEGDVNVYGGHYNNYIIYESGVSHISNDEIGIDIEGNVIAPEEFKSDKIIDEVDEVVSEPINEVMVESDEITTENSELMIKNNDEIKIPEINEENEVIFGVIEETENELLVKTNEEIPNDIITEINLDKKSENKKGIFKNAINKIKNILKVD